MGKIIETTKKAFLSENLESRKQKLASPKTNQPTNQSTNQTPPPPKKIKSSIKCHVINVDGI